MSEAHSTGFVALALAVLYALSFYSEGMAIWASVGLGLLGGPLTVVAIYLFVSMMMFLERL